MPPLRRAPISQKASSDAFRGSPPAYMLPGKVCGDVIRCEGGDFTAEGL